MSCSWAWAKEYGHDIEGLKYMYFVHIHGLHSVNILLPFWHLLLLRLLFLLILSLNHLSQDFLLNSVIDYNLLFVQISLSISKNSPKGTFTFLGSTEEWGKSCYGDLLDTKTENSKLYKSVLENGIIVLGSCHVDINIIHLSFDSFF